MFKIITTLTLALTLTGCYALMPVKYAANQVCGASNERKEELAVSFDKATFPHTLRINCHDQENR